MHSMKGHVVAESTRVSAGLTVHGFNRSISYCCLLMANSRFGSASGKLSLKIETFDRAHGLELLLLGRKMSI
jgi:hypothetical protein